MKDQYGTDEQLLSELKKLRQRITELETIDSKRKRAEESLQKSEEKFRSLVDSTEDSIYLVNRNCPKAASLLLTLKQVSRRRD